MASSLITFRDPSDEYKDMLRYVVECYNEKSEYKQVNQTDILKYLIKREYKDLQNNFIRDVK